MTEPRYRPGPYDDEQRHAVNIPLYLVLTIVTAFLPPSAAPP